MTSVGIISIELYFPKIYISQTELERFNNESGKYTKGLGQTSMAVCAEAEDVNSLALTVTQKLIERTHVDLTKIGFLEFGTETLIDKSKSTKSVLMQLFKTSGNNDIAGTDVKSACYGSTAALFNALNWLESSNCEGRLALVVAADIAIYQDKNTQPTGGAGGIAILLGRNAPLVMDSGVRVSCMEHRFDFYKPIMGSVFACVDGKLSLQCYKEAFLSCYSLYRRKVEKITGQLPSVVSSLYEETKQFPIDYVCCHTPFCRLVAKSFGWLVLEDIKAAKDIDHTKNTKIDQLVTKLLPVIAASPAGDISLSREMDALCLEASESLFEEKVKPGLKIASEVGNMYTASLYSCLVSLGCMVPEDSLRNKRVLLFAYGSGYTSSMFSLVISPNASMSSIFGITDESSPITRLGLRIPINADQFHEMIRKRESDVDKAPANPSFSSSEFFPGSYYLSQIDSMHRRFYLRVPDV